MADVIGPSRACRLSKESLGLGPRVTVEVQGLVRAGCTYDNAIRQLTARQCIRAAGTVGWKHAAQGKMAF